MAVIVLVTLTVLFIAALLFLRRKPSKFTVGLFHPYADAGGGGERVLWHALSSMIHEWPNVRYVILTGDKGRTPRQILDKVKSRFGISVQENEVNFIFLRLRFLIEASTWPRFTLAGQVFGSIVLGIEAICHCCPHVFFDTMGYAFTYPLYKWLVGSKVLSYVHYPIVSTDMLSMVASGKATYNNTSGIGRSKVLTSLKIKYYRILAYFYGFVGRHSDAVLVNSSWTHGHIKDIWNCENTSIVYPPCDCKTFLEVPSTRSSIEYRIVSVGQFRPEKDHKKQIDVIRILLNKWNGSQALKLVLIGSCRDEEDHARVEMLKKYAFDKSVSEHVEFLVNLPFSKLQMELGRSLIAIHTMWNEHFGISLVECMASGCIMVANRSGGPLMDIVTNFKECRTGFLAESADEFSECIIEVFNMSAEERNTMVLLSKESVSERFSVQTFQTALITKIQTVMKMSLK